MIITRTHPDWTNIRAFDTHGNYINDLDEIDTHRMIGKRIVSILPKVYIKTKLYKITGPGIFFKRNDKRSRIINTSKKTK